MAKEQSETTESEAVTMIADAFGDLEFVTVYEGIGETWDFNINPVLIGTYMRSEQTEMLKYGSKTETELRDVYTIKTSSGDLAAVWGSFAINRAFKDIPTGKVVRITYTGKNQIGETDKDVKAFVIDVAK